MRLRVLTIALLTALASPGLALAEKLTPAETASRIDDQFASRWKDRKVTPASPADDAEWVRRVYLDLTGRIPDIMAARDFIDNQSKDKKAKLIAELLDSPRYPIHWANVARNWWLPDASESQNMYFALYFEATLRTRFQKNVAYDALVKEIIGDNAAAYTSLGYSFNQAHRLEPANLASAAARMFLGVKLECAQCHNHPFAKWKKQQFWEFAAFFAEVAPTAVYDPEKMQNVARKVTPGEIVIVGTDKTAKVKFLDGKEPASSGSYRPIIATWIASKENPYFARAGVNRVWEYLLGTGLVEPVDEESTDNPPSHPAVLDLLAKQFAEHGFDLKYLIQSITLTRAYQLSSKQTDPAQADARLFARMKVRGLSPEQLWDSLALATGQRDEDDSFNPYGGFRQVNVSSPRYEFLRRFPNQDKRTEQQTSILQALYLMNGKVVADATSLEHNKNLAIIAEAKTVRTTRRVEQLFLITLARKPTSGESARLVKYVESGGPKKDSARALCDVFWALLNSSEFSSNH